ncbi:MAG TPA: hypothetical protein VF532_05905 [Candidatus Angelobacter sp.]
MVQMPQLIRRQIIHLHKAGNQAVASDVAAYEFQSHGRIVEVETYLGNIGGTSGSTSVDGKLNGTSIFTTVPSIAFNATTKRRRDSATVPAGASGGTGSSVLTPIAGEPLGVRFHPGDYYRVDVTTIPGTASSDLSVFLHVVLEDV